MKRVCVDIGGTFTDCVVLDDDGALQETKASTTPWDPVIGLLAGLEKAADRQGLTLEEFLGQVELLVHGTTLATNTLITGRGARTGMITTENFRDVIEMRRGLRDQEVSMYNLFIPPYNPLVPRRWRVGVPERIRYTGEVLTPLSPVAVKEAASKLQGQGVESVAICFLHSYKNPDHEREAKKVCEEVFGVGRVTLSHEVLPVWREFERFSTTVVSAYLEPVVSDYLMGLQDKLASVGFGGALLMMLANGLVQPPQQCLGRAVYLLGSGPAAAPSSAVYFGSDAGSSDLISLDMGGTSLDVCVVRNAEVPTTTDAWIGDHRVAIKMVDIHSVGAGGGSIGWVDSLGLLRVGPDSAGADPGPACYGVGSQATVTDADVVLGYVPVDYFLGGEITLSMESARNALERLGEPLAMSTEIIAQAVFDTANSYMADQVTEVCTRRGLDVRDFTLVVGGGAGPVHAAAIAKQLGLHNVIIPTVAALYSAFGMLTMDLGRDYSRSLVGRADDIDPEAVDLLFREMEQEALGSLRTMDIAEDSIMLTRTAEMRYLGQYHEVEVPIASGRITADSLKEAVRELHRMHESLYTFSMPWLSAEFLTFRLRASSSPSRFSLRSVETGSSEVPAAAMRRKRKCLWSGEWIDTPVFDGDRLLAGNRIEGPAIIEDQTTTTVVPKGCICTVDTRKNYLLRL